MLIFSESSMHSVRRQFLNVLHATLTCRLLAMKKIGWDPNFLNFLTSCTLLDSLPFKTQQPTSLLNHLWVLLCMLDLWALDSAICFFSAPL